MCIILGYSSLLWSVTHPSAFSIFPLTLVFFTLFQNSSDISPPCHVIQPPDVLLLPFRYCFICISNGCCFQAVSFKNIWVDNLQPFHTKSAFLHVLLLNSQPLPELCLVFFPLVFPSGNALSTWKTLLFISKSKPLPHYVFKVFFFTSAHKDLVLWCWAAKSYWETI